MKKHIGENAIVKCFCIGKKCPFQGGVLIVTLERKNKNLVSSIGCLFSMLVIIRPTAFAFV